LDAAPLLAAACCATVTPLALAMAPAKSSTSVELRESWWITRDLLLRGGKSNVDLGRGGVYTLTQKKY